MKTGRIVILGAITAAVGGAAISVSAEHHEVDRAALRGQAAGIFGSLPQEVAKPGNPLNDDKIALGRMLYYDPRLSRSQQISCNSCHQLDNHGVDNEPTSPGHNGQRGGRNSPTVYNAAFHVAQFWDGRAPDVEAQAKGPVLNPVEMAMRSEADTVAVLASIPAYPPMFAKAFPDADEPLSYDHMADAIGAFERRLMTPSRFDAFLAGDDDALTEAELVGLSNFVTSGCVTCHMGPGVGGSLYRKLGQVVPYEDDDPGRFEVTGQETDRQVFKVPSLRNVAETAPYFHDGSIATLEEAIRLMGKHQLGLELDDERVRSIATFLRSLTGEPDATYIAEPELPASGPSTPKPDFS